MMLSPDIVNPILVILIALLIVGSYVAYKYDEIRNLRYERKSIAYLCLKGWKLTKDSEWSGLEFQAQDEDEPRYLHEALERQEELDRIKNLNLHPEPRQLFESRPRKKRRPQKQQLGKWKQ